MKDLLHLSAIAWARAGAELLQISEWLGHSTIGQTVIYAKYLVTEEELSPIASMAGNIYAG